MIFYRLILALWLLIVSNFLLLMLQREEELHNLISIGINDLPLCSDRTSLVCVGGERHY